MTTRLTDPAVIERRLLDFAYTTTAELTPPALAYFAPCSIEDAGKVLDDLAARGRVDLDVDDEGVLRYTLVGRSALPAAAPAMPAYVPTPNYPPLPVLARPSYLVPVRRFQPLRTASPTLAAILSLFVPGAGQAYAGRWVSAALWFMLVGAAYALILPGLVLHFFCIVSAASSAHRLNSLAARTHLQLAGAADQMQAMPAA